MRYNQNNVINFHPNKPESPVNQAAGEYVYMPYVIYVPVFVPAQNVETKIAEVIKESIKDKTNTNVVSIYDYLGEI